MYDVRPFGLDVETSVETNVPSIASGKAQPYIKVRKVPKIVDEANKFSYFISNVDGELSSAVNELKSILTQHSQETRLVDLAKQQWR